MKLFAHATHTDTYCILSQNHFGLQAVIGLINYSVGFSSYSQSIVVYIHVFSHLLTIYSANLTSMYLEQNVLYMSHSALSAAEGQGTMDSPF